MSLRCKSHNGHEVELFYGPGRRFSGRNRVSEPIAVYRIDPPVPGRTTPRRRAFAWTREGVEGHREQRRTGA